MSVSTFMGLETALRGLLAQQRQLDVTAHNVANANTPGYTRQTATLTASTPFNTTNGQLGTGVDVQNYTRIRDAFLDVQLHAQTMVQGYESARQDALQQVELAVDEPSDNGLSNLLQKYWSAWSDVANSPENAATRQALLQAGEALADGINGLYGQLKQIDAQAAQNITLTANDVQQTLNDVIALQGQIENGGSNDLLDKRDALLDHLGTLVNVSAADDTTTGAFKIQLDGIVVYPPSQVLATTTVPPTEADLVAASQSGGSTLPYGKLAGLVASRASVQGYMGSLDVFAQSLMGSVNALQTAGYALDGTHPGCNFFDGTGAGDIAVSTALAADPSLVAAGKPLADGSAPGPGDGQQALAIAALRGTPGVDGLYQSLVTTIGSDSQAAQRGAANAQVLADALTNRRESLSGVSLDEEMTNLVRYQRAYQASARALTAMDDLISTLIDRTGKVGM